MTRRISVISLACSLVLAAAIVGAPAASAAKLPGTSCRLFPSDNVWNTRGQPAAGAREQREVAGVDGLVHREAAPGLRTGGEGSSRTASRGRSCRRRRRSVAVAFGYDDESDPGPYPLTASTPIEGGSDRHAIMVNSSTCTLYELYAHALQEPGSVDRGLRRDLEAAVRTRCDPAAGRRPMRPGFRSCPASSTTTR